MNEIDRLTEKHENGTAMIKGCGANCKYGFANCRKEDWENCKTIDDVIDKLADYEDAEEQGLLLRLPVAIGSEVWNIINQRDNFTDIPYKIVTIVNFRLDMLKEIGKTVFLTREEAEKALADQGRCKE